MSRPLVSFVVYRSIAAAGTSDRAFVKLVQQTWRNNAAAGLTGCLVFDKGTFRQVLEGEPDQVARTMDRILADPRHTAVRVTRYALRAERRFEDWTCLGFERFLGARTVMARAAARASVEEAHFDGPGARDVASSA
ncbi:MAG: BLUF domain-containing protein [Pseudomonadota bacterium]